MSCHSFEYLTFDVPNTLHPYGVELTDSAEDGDVVDLLEIRHFGLGEKSFGH